MNQAILDGLPLRRLLVIIARRAYVLLRASLTVACTPAEDQPGLAVRSAIGHRAQGMRGLTIPVNRSEVEDLPDSAPISLESEPWSGRFPAEVTARLRAGLLVPLRAQQRTMGLLLFANQRWAGSFGDGDQRRRASSR